MAVTTGTATRTTTRHPAASTAPLTVRIVEGRLFLCAPTEELLAAPADEAGIDLAASRTVPVLLDDGSTGTWYGAPVVGSLRFQGAWRSSKSSAWTRALICGASWPIGVWASQ